VEESRTCQPLPDLVPRTDMIHLSKYLGSSLGKLLVKLSLRCYSFMGSSSVIVVDILVECP
jgi:hypothetical protein